MLTVIERKLFGTLVAMSDDKNKVRGKTMTQIAKQMGYKTSGGVITLAMQTLEMRNRIKVTYEEGSKKFEVEVYL